MWSWYSNWYSSSSRESSCTIFTVVHTILNKEYKYHRHQEHTHHFVLSVSFTQHHAKKHTYHLDDERLVFRRRAWLGLILWGCTIWLGSYYISLRVTLYSFPSIVTFASFPDNESSSNAGARQWFGKWYLGIRWITSIVQSLKSGVLRTNIMSASVRTYESMHCPNFPL